jgi:hypothetical protein
MFRNYTLQAFEFWLHCEHVTNISKFFAVTKKQENFAALASSTFRARACFLCTRADIIPATWLRPRNGTFRLHFSFI